MANITQLTDKIWTGGDLPEAEDLATAHIRHWQYAGITTVIDCRHEWSDKDLVAAVAPEIHYVHLGIDDAGQRIPPAWFEQALIASNTSLTGGVLAPCHMGINRGPSAAFALLLAEGLTPNDAIELIRVRRPIAAVGYAEDALRWWHHRNHNTAHRRRVERDQLASWRNAHPHDTVRIIRTIKDKEKHA